MKQQKKKAVKFLSRKLIVLLLLFTFATVFMVFEVGDTTFGEWSQFALVLYGLYIGGNVGSQLISKNLTQQQYIYQQKRKRYIEDEDQEAI